MRKQCIIIAGPTAVGKTSVAIQLAKILSAEIISADSRQCYKELTIGVARPSKDELAQVPHHFIASHSIHDSVTAVDFAHFAQQKVKMLFERMDHVVMVGGTGLYINAFTEGLDAIPKVPEAVRQQVICDYTTQGIAWLQHEISHVDPLFASAGEMQNPQRMMRALEVWRHTGNSILSFRQTKKCQHDFDITLVGLNLPRPILNERIDIRVDQMMQDGLVEEVRGLLDFQHLNALRTVGYSELFEYLNGYRSLQDAVNLIKIHTHQYAKRQVTWFNKVKNLTWMNSEDLLNSFKTM